MALEELVSDTGHVEHALGDGGADDQDAEVGSEVRRHGNERVAQHVHRDDAPRGEALAERHPHEVLLTRLDDRVAREPHHVGEVQCGEHDRRKYQVRPGRTSSDRRSEQMQLDGEEVLRDEGQHEHRDRDEQKAHQHRGVVEKAVLAQAGDETDDDAEEQLDDERQQRETQRHRELRGEDLIDALAAESRSQVALEQVAEVDQVAREERLVQVVLRLQGGVLRIGRCLVTEQSENRVTR